MIFCDTHTHLYLKEFEEDREEVIRRAKNVGVKYFFLPNIDSGSIEAMYNLHNAYPENCFAMMGLHPTSVKGNFEEELAIVERELRGGTYIAVGEVGIDLYWDKTYRTQQYEAFHRQIEWALEMNLPLIIHSRESFNEIMEVLGRFKGKPLKGIFHCFSGTAEQAKQITDRGFYLGIGGVLTFKNSKLSDSLRDIPVENILLETDAPFLAPVPHRGKRNESAYIPLIAQKLAEIKGMSTAEVAEITTASALKLFAINK